MHHEIRTTAMRTRHIRNLKRFPWRAAVLVVALACTSAGQQVDIQNLVKGGTREAMRGPNFTADRNSVPEFYEPAGYAPAWVHGSQPVPPALALIEQFR